MAEPDMNDQATRDRQRSDLLRAVAASPEVNSVVEAAIESRINAYEKKRKEEEESRKATDNLGRLRGEGGKTARKGYSEHIDKYPLGAIGMTLAMVNATHDRNSNYGVVKLPGKVEERAAAYAEQRWGADARVTRALAAGEFGDGGVFVRGDIRQEFTDLLLPAVAVLSLGPVIVPMPSGTLEAPRVSSDVTAKYRGEGQKPTPSKPGTQNRLMSAKFLDGLVPVSNPLIRRGGPEVARFVERLMVRRVGIRKDQAFLADKGLEGTPKGLRYWAGTTVAASSVDAKAPTQAETLGMLGAMISRLEEANVGLTKLAFLLAPRVKNYMMFRIVTGLGVPYFLEMMKSGELLGWPFRSTTSIVANEGGTADESYVMLANMENVLVGETLNMQLKTSDVASYTEGSEVRSCFERDETAFLINDEHDLFVEHPEAVTVLSGVRWGAP